VALAGAGAAAAQGFAPIQVGNGGPSLSVPMQIALSLTLLTLLPAVIMCITPFLRITIVLHFLRQALGTQTAPSNQVLIGLSMFLTSVIVYPTASQIYNQAWAPMEKGQISTAEAMTRGSEPLRVFLSKFVREKDARLFLEITKSPAPRTPADLELKVLIPAYILSELKTGFQIGAVLFLPFLIIDLVVASVLMSMGMMMLPPVVVSLPFKLIFFVLVDGWSLVAGSLVQSYGGS
jgi:flagellar biosynthetic protein FliP